MQASLLYGSRCGVEVYYRFRVAWPAMHRMRTQCKARSAGPLLFAATRLTQQHGCERNTLPTLAERNIAHYHKAPPQPPMDSNWGIWHVTGHRDNGSSGTWRGLLMPTGVSAQTLSEIAYQPSFDSVQQSWRGGRCWL